MPPNHYYHDLNSQRNASFTWILPFLPLLEAISSACNTEDSHVKNATRLFHKHGGGRVEITLTNALGYFYGKQNG